MGGIGGGARVNAVDLHTHTTESDGTYEPLELVQAAARAGIRTLAITDHDNMAAYEIAGPAARDAGVELIRGIELSTKYHGHSVHLLGYFFNGEPAPEFDAWIGGMLDNRRDRNRRLAQRLREIGLDIHVEDAERYGRRMTGRPHFARALVAKGYVSTIREAFDKYIGEEGGAYVERESPGIAEAITRILDGGGVPSLAHPVRLPVRDHCLREAMISEFAAVGLPAIETFHSDHSAGDTRRYIGLAEKYGLAMSGGSDFHGANKPGVELGRGINGNLRIPDSIVPALRALSR